MVQIYIYWQNTCPYYAVISHRLHVIMCVCFIVGQLPCGISFHEPTIILIQLPITTALGLPQIQPDVEQANTIFTGLKQCDWPVKSLPSRTEILMKLAGNMTADWKPVGRMLGIDEASLYAIQQDNAYSVREQAYQMFYHWITKNGSKATIGILTTAIYEAGSVYWNLLNVLNDCCW